MVFKHNISADTIRSYVYHLYKHANRSLRYIAKECCISPSSVVRIVKAGIHSHKINSKKSTKKSVRPMKLSARQQRVILRTLPKLREQNPSFSIRELMLESGIKCNTISGRTVIRFLHKHKYFLLQTRNKGLMTKKDLRRRVAFAKEMESRYNPNVWTEGVAFYSDGTAFAFKTNPLDQAKAPKGRIWRKLGEGLTSGCTSKGRKEGTGGKLVKLMVAISYNEGVVLCQTYVGNFLLTS